MEGTWEWGVTANRYKVSIWGDENVLELGRGDTFIIFEHTKNHCIVLDGFYTM